MKYAVVENGSKQIIVKEGEKVLIDQLELEKGSKFTWDNVLVLRDGDKLDIGTPYVEKVKVTGTVGEEVKGNKVINFKKKRRKGYIRKVGHRQKYTEVFVEEIK
jgi:large subunit ribosomal protein L21